MELFVIQCTTCRARLKVHDPSLVDDIVECPRCGSFVEVQAPAGWQRPAAGAADSGTAERAAQGELAGKSSLTRATPRTSKQAAAAVIPPPLPSELAAEAMRAPVPPAASRVAGPPRAAAAAGTSSLIVPDLSGDGPSFVRRAAGALRGNWRLAAGGFAGALVAVVALSLVVAARRATGEADPAAEPSTSSLTAADAPAPADEDESLAAVDRPADDLQPTDAESNPNEPNAAVAHQAARPVLDPPAAEAAEPAADDDSSPSGSADSSVSADPLDLLVRTIAPEPDPLPTSNAGEVPRLGPDRSPGSAAEPDAFADDEAAAVRQSQMLAHLQDKLPPIEFKDVPLGHFAAFVSEFSTVPIAIDSASLLEIGKGSKTKVSVRLPAATVEEALQAALSRPGLTFRAEAGRLLIVADPAKNQR